MRLPVSPYLPTRTTKTLAEVSARGSSPVVTDTWYLVTAKNMLLRLSLRRAEKKGGELTGKRSNVRSNGRKLNNHFSVFVTMLSDPVAILEVKLLLAVDVFHLDFIKKPVGVSACRVDVNANFY